MNGKYFFLISGMKMIISAIQNLRFQLGVVKKLIYNFKFFTSIYEGSFESKFTGPISKD